MNKSPKLKLVWFFLIILFFLICPVFVLAKQNEIVVYQTLPDNGIENNSQTACLNLYFFYSKICPHCEKEALFLSQLKKQYQDKIEIYSFEVTDNSANAELFQKFGQVYKTDVSGVPVIFIGDKNITGYYNDEYTGAEIKNLVDQCLNLKCPDLGHYILFPDEECDEQENRPCPDNKKIVKLPIIGEINLENFSLRAATLILGGLDGFNPCAMWVLIFLISLLLSIESAKRRWLLGLTFIIASGLVYFIFMAAWLNIFLFIGYLLIVRIIIGSLAIVFGIYNLRKYFKNKSGICEVTNSQSRQKILEKLKNTTLNSGLLAAMFGIIILAFAVNLIELACSAGFPAVYTKILASHNLSTLSYYLYLFFYIIIFMLDDIIVFTLAMITLKLTGVDTKYSRYSNLIGGAVILILGILLIVKPGLLMF